MPSVGRKGKIYGILSVPNKCHGGIYFTNLNKNINKIQKFLVITECATNNGNCPYLCLPSSTSGHVCKCPDNVKEHLVGCS